MIYVFQMNDVQGRAMSMHELPNVELVKDNVKKFDPGENP